MTEDNPLNAPTTYIGMAVHTGAGESRADALQRMRKEFVLPCGAKLLNIHDDIPLTDVPCPCGDPNHWLLRWYDQ